MKGWVWIKSYGSGFWQRRAVLNIVREAPDSMGNFLISWKTRGIGFWRGTLVHAVKDKLGKLEKCLVGQE